MSNTGGVRPATASSCEEHTHRVSQIATGSLTEAPGPVEFALEDKTNPNDHVKNKITEDIQRDIFGCISQKRTLLVVVDWHWSSCNPKEVLTG